MKRSAGAYKDPAREVRSGARRFSRSAGRPLAASAVWTLAMLASSRLAAAGPPDVAELEDEAIRAAVARVAPSLVRIDLLGGQERVGRFLVGSAPATGVVVSADGYVLSSAYHFAQEPASILVTLPSGRRAAAEIISRDHSRMLLLLKVNTDEKLTPARWVPRDQIQVGQWAIAVGRTYEQDQPNVSVGIVSALDRIWGKAIQTDAKVSPKNYGGALADIRGRVLGILTPLSLEGGLQLSGAQWYDSGIGFAVPLADLAPRLDAMAAGADLYPGRMGVTIKPGDLYADPAVVATVHPKSPAAQAGLAPGDRIVEANGTPIKRRARLQQVLGPLYAGDPLQVAVMRGGRRLEMKLQLTDHIEPYEHPFLGVLPDRRPNAAARGVAIRYVYPGSGAAKAGLRPGDTLLALDGKPIANAAAARQLLAAYEPGGTIRAEARRQEQSLQREIALSRLPVSIPKSLPPAAGPSTPPPAAGPPVGVVPLDIPEEPNACVAYVPASYDPRCPPGLVVWLHAPGRFDQKQLVNRWKSHCHSRGLILLAPQAADPDGWQAAETAFIRKAINEVLGAYRIDPARIVAAGYQAGGAMAYLVAFGQRDLVRGVAAVDAPLPRTIQPPDNQPLQRLAVYSASSANSPLARRIAAGLQQLQAMKYPVTVKDLGEAPRPLNDQEIDELARWIDTLDRL